MRTRCYVSLMSADDTDELPVDPIERQRWLNGIIPLSEGAEIRGVHPDTLKRLDRKLREEQKPPILVRRSARLWGIRRRDAHLIKS